MPSNKRSIPLKPWMAAGDARLIKKALLGLGEKKLSVLEWGSGGSTIYFTRFLMQKKIAYHWLSLEYNRNWHRRISAYLKKDENIRIRLFDCGNDSLYQQTTQMDEYIKYPATLKRKFDLILVDGRKRRRCFLLAKKLVERNGIIFLHDAERPYYHCAFKHFPGGRFIGRQLWYWIKGPRDILK